MKTEPIVAVVPARGGSKGIPRKNLVELEGKPLIAYSIDAALKANSIGRVVVSTEDEEIAAVSRSLGAEVPFLRPKPLAGDSTPMVDVLQNLLEQFAAAGVKVRAVVLLQPTSPLRRALHIDEAVRLFERQDADSVVSVVRVPHAFTPPCVWRMEEDGRVSSWMEKAPLLTRRQDKPVLYARNGPAVVVARPELIASGRLYSKHTYGYEMSPLDSLDIDTPDDLELVSAWMRHRATNAT